VGPWNSGDSNGHNGSCIGVIVSSWSAKKIVFTFGSGYSGQLADGDLFVVAVKGISLAAAPCPACEFKLGPS
jgi:hypothetical protein